MNTKTCSKCGWVYPIKWPGRRCKFCQTPFSTNKCSVCGNEAPKLYKGACTKCTTERHNKWVQQQKDKANEALSDWLNKIAQQPTKTLTEEQWLNACKHFGGCAYCGGSDIDVRSMFISFKEGGRYCAWNIVPSCERCETVRKSVRNPFLRMNQTFYRGSRDPAKKYGYSLEKLQKITDYLQSNMEDKQ